MARNSSTFTFKFTGKDQSVGKTLDGMERKMGGFGGFVNRWGGRVAGAIAGAFVVDKLVGFGSELFDLGNELAIFDVKVDTVFGSAADSVREWADRVNESLGLSDEAVAGLAAGMGDLLVPLGATREQAAQSSQEMIELSGALSAWSAGQYDASQVAEILTKAQLGERDSLKSLGISINQAEVDQRALIVAQEDGRDAVTGLDKAIATQQLILEKSTDAQAAWNDGSFDAIKRNNELKATWADLKNEMAEAFLPAANAVTGWLVETAIPALQDFRDWVGPKLRAALDSFSEWWDENGPKIVGFLDEQWESAQATWLGMKSVLDEELVPALESLMGSFGRLGEAADELGGSIGGLTSTVGINVGGWERLGQILGVLVLGAIRQVDASVRVLTAALEGTGYIVDGTKAQLRFLGGTVRWLKDRFSDLYNQVKRAWDLISSPPSIPGVGTIVNKAKDVAGAVTGNADGGYITRPELSWLGEGGQPEFVLNAEQMRGLAAQGISIGANRQTSGVVLNTYVTVQGSVLSERDLADAVNTATRRGLIGSGAF